MKILKVTKSSVKSLDKNIQRLEALTAKEKFIIHSEILQAKYFTQALRANCDPTFWKWLDNLVERAEDILLDIQGFQNQLHEAQSKK